MNRKTTQPTISIDEADSLTPGVQIEQTPDQAEENGAFEETALSEEEAWESNLTGLEDKVSGGPKTNE